MKWTVKNYNAFIRDARAEHGLSLGAARQMYRNMAERVGRPLFAKDLERHPRISKQEATRAPRSEAARKAAETRARNAQERAAKPGRASGKEPAPASPRAPRRRERETEEGFPAPARRIIHSAEEWEEFYDDELDGEWEDWEGTPEYERTPS